MSDEKKRIHEKATKYVGYWLKVVDFADDVLLAAHDAVSAIGNVASDAVDLAQDALYSASVKLDEYREFVNSNVDEAERKAYGDIYESPEGPVVKPVKPTADMSRDEKINFIIAGYGLDDTEQQRTVLKASSDAALTTAVDIIKSRNQ